MKTISISQWAAAVNQSPNQQKITKATSLPLFASAMLFFSVVVASAQVTVPVGNLAPGESVTITFDVALTNPFPAGVFSVTNKGTLSGSNFSPLNSDDPATATIGDATVTVVEVPPAVVTLPATGIGVTNATLNGSVNPNGLATKYWLQFGLTTNYNNTTAPNSAGNGTTAVPVSSFIGTLNPGTLYHFQFIATNSAGTNFGGDLSFTTLQVFPPQLTSSLSNGVFSFSFTNTSGLTFSLFGTTNLSVPFSNWTALSAPVEGPPGVYQATNSATNDQRYYRVTWP